MNTESTNPTLKLIRREGLLFLFFAFLGIVVLPFAVWFVGNQVFGEFAGDGFGGFYRDLAGDVRALQPVALFLVFSPYLGVQLLRLTFFAFRQTGKRHSH